MTPADEDVARVNQCQLHGQLEPGPQPDARVNQCQRHAAPDAFTDGNARHFRQHPEQPSRVNQCQRRSDPVVERARPAFLYVMYALLLWTLPMGWIAALRPATAAAMTRGMAAYLAALPEPLYALFGTGYLGYTVARSWGKARAGER